MDDNIRYTERLSSKWTEALFLALTLIFFLLAISRLPIRNPEVLLYIFMGFFLLFVFYVLNYRTLEICLTPEALKLTFGIFHWAVPLENIAECRLDEIPLFMRMGGAGIHFMLIRQRYRASFNFLEHPRVVITLKRKAGLVQDISFSTRYPEKIIPLIQEAISANRAPEETASLSASNEISGRIY